MASLRAGATGRVGALLVATITLGWATHAAPHDSEWSGIAHRGPVGAARTLVERARTRLDEGDAPGARAEAESLLSDLRGRLADPDALIPPDVIEDLARAAIRVRNQAVVALEPLGEGSRAGFLAATVDAAVYSDWRWDVPASVTLAQAVLESDWGRSAPGNNLFGMKGVGPAGATERPVVEYSRGRRKVKRAKFRAYLDVAGSLYDHGRLLGERPVYARARAGGEDPAAWARGLVGVYATDPRYATKLVDLIDRRDLDRFDWAPASPFAVAPGASPAPPAPVSVVAAWQDPG